MLIWGGNVANGVDVNGNATQLEGDPPTQSRHGVNRLQRPKISVLMENSQRPPVRPPRTRFADNVSYSGSTTVVTGNTTADHNTFAGPSGSPAALWRHCRQILSLRPYQLLPAGTTFTQPVPAATAAERQRTGLRDRGRGRSSTSRRQLATRINRFLEAYGGQPF